MTRPGVLLVAVLVALVGLAGSVEAVRLVATESHEGGLTVQVQTPHPTLTVRAPSGNLTLDGHRLASEAQEVQAPGTSWRGFANVTTLTVTGTGELMITSNGTGVLVPVEESPGEGSARSNGTSGTDPSTEGSTEGPPANPEGATDPGGEQPSPTSSSRETSAPAGEQHDGRPDSSPGPSWMGNPVAVALALLAVGAGLVERWTRTASEDEPDP